jgi:hypothetical protein
MKQLKLCLLILSALVALVSCGGNEPSLPTSPIILRPEDFVEGEASLTLDNLAPDESVAVIPVYATQDFQKDMFEFSISAENISPQLPKQTAQLASQNSQPYQNHSDHIAFLEQSIALVNDLQRRGIPPLGRGDIQSQAFDKCPPPYTPGKQCQFWVRTRGEMARITATLQQVSPHAYWFVQNEDLSDLNTKDIARLVTSFEEITIPTDTRYFGDPPDVDGNGKIIIVFSSLLPDLLGYVFGVDLFPDGQFKGIHSNEGDIFYAATPKSVSKFMDRDEYFQAGMPSTMTHEFKHLIAFGKRVLQDLPLEDLWLEEPSAMAAQQLAGQGSQTEQFQLYAADALATPQDFRVTHEGRPSDPAEQRSMYGYNFLFLWRIGEELGHETFWPALVQSPETGVANLEVQTGQSFADLMLDWSLTLLFDHTSLLPGYDYQDLDLRDGSWEPLGYRSLHSLEGTARSVAYYLGRGQGTDATITVRSDDAAPYVIVVRFKGTLPW